MEYTSIIAIILYYFSYGSNALSTESGCDGSGFCTIPSFCQEGWTYYYERCYRVVSTSASYVEARSMCHLVKGYLPVIKNSDENNYLDGIDGYAKWIGFDDLTSEGYFIWGNEYKLSSTYTSWSTAEPSNANDNEHCVELRTSGGWNDLPCERDKYTVCEMDLTPRMWYPRGHSMYLFNIISQRWLDVRDSCQEVGAHLVVIGDSDENSWVISTALSKRSSANWWIGINDYSSEGTFSWPDSGEFVSYTYWLSDEPNNAGGNEDGVTIGYSTHQWNDIITTNIYPSICEKGIDWQYFNGKRYFATDYKMSASDAIATCADIGGELVTISSKEENTFLVNMITETHYSQSAAFYIGYTSDSNSVWSWSDGSENLYTNWGEGKGQLASGCAQIKLGIGGQWNDKDCTSHRGFICESDIQWIPWHNEKYYINPTPMTYDKAREVCMKIGGDLVSYDTVEEERVVTRLLERTSIITSKYKRVYIGNRKEDGVFRWARTNTASTISNWCSGEPSGGSEYCTEYMSDSDCYNDLSCSVFRASVCEADLYPSDGSLWEQRRYFVNPYSSTYDTAQTKCAEMGMELVSITSEHELNIVIDAAHQYSPTNHYYWIGYNDIATEGTYTWGSASPGRPQVKGFEKFHSSPDFNDNNDCVVLRPDYEDWDSVPCSNSYYHVCEISGEEDYVFTEEISDTEMDVPSDACVEGHSLKEIKVRSEVECLTACVTNTACLSVNYYQNHPDNDVTNCQLNKIFRSSYPDDVFVRSTCSYYEFK